MKISPKDEQEQNVQMESTIDNKLEMLKFASQVQSRIKTDISEDFILAKLGEQDKKGIIEMTGNAYFAKKILYLLANKATEYKWNKSTKTWTKQNISKDKQDFIKQIGKTTFDAYLTRIYMTVILNRNVEKNHLLRILAGIQEEEQEEPSKIKGFQEQLQNLMKPNEEK